MKDQESKTMLAYQVVKSGDTEGHLVSIPKPKTTSPDEALIRILRAGICNTDLEILKGYMGFTGVLGHEFVGVVESVHDDNQNDWVGKRVCGDINVGCDDCPVCHDVDNWDKVRPKISRNHCPNRTVLGILNKDGTMAEYITLPLRNLHVVPDGVPDSVAAFAEPLAAACRIVEQNLVRYDEGEGRYPVDENVAILGDGKLGLMIAEVLGREYTSRFGESSSSEGGNVPNKPILFGKHLHKMELVSDSGVDFKEVKECQDESSMNGVSKEHSGVYDVVVDATGSPSGLSLAIGMCKPMGTLVLKSTCAAGEKFNAAPIVIDELKVVGSRCGPINRALELLSLDESTSNSAMNGITPLNVNKYITKTFPLKDAEKAIAFAAERSTMKVQILCSSD